MSSSGKLRSVALVRTDDSEELSASIIRVKKTGELGTALAVTSNRPTLRRMPFLTCRFIYELQDAISQNMIIFITIIARTSIPTMNICIYGKCYLCRVFGLLASPFHTGRYGRYERKNVANGASPNDVNMRNGTSRPLYCSFLYLHVCVCLCISVSTDVTTEPNRVVRPKGKRPVISLLDSMKGETLCVCLPEARTNGGRTGQNVSLYLETELQWMEL
jgi:hypothetical protein